MVLAAFSFYAHLALAKMARGPLREGNERFG